MPNTCLAVHTNEQRSEPLDLSNFPPIYVLTSHIASQELRDAEDKLTALKAPLTYNVKEAKLILGNVTTARRAKLELQWLGVYINEDSRQTASLQPPKKRTKFENAPSSPGGTVSNDNGHSSTRESDSHEPESQGIAGLSISLKQGLVPLRHGGIPDLPDPSLSSDKVVIARLEWLQRSFVTKSLLPLSSFILLCGQSHVVGEETTNHSEPPENVVETTLGRQLEPSHSGETRQTILERAKRDEKPVRNRFFKRDRIKAAAEKDFVGRSFSSSTQLSRDAASRFDYSRPTHLLRQTTSEHDETDSEPLPPLPDWVLKKQLYACERATPAEQPNQDFIAALSRIKLARILTLDDIGVRAYSTSIAALAAYPYRLRSPSEILTLPGCDQKIAHLFHEYQKNNGHLQAVIDLEADPVQKTLKDFYEIWGVGAVTARDFYYDKGWTDLDDVIEFGWRTLNRVQQIGLKYYDEFQLKIPRTEVECIATAIDEHAKKATDPNIQTVIVGGYRRGKSESGDVDVIVSHPNQDVTLDLVSEIVKSLENDGWITHTLTLNLTNSKRNQETLPLRTPTSKGPGFDTLDKALVVWQDPNWPSKDTGTAESANAKNPNPHRRVDIIISPWRTVGCAVAGWTSGTTFQRDLRRYVKKKHGWKFDSSGVRSRATGEWIDLEKWRNPETRCKDWKEAERRVFEGIGLEYREPWERCTW